MTFQEHMNYARERNKVPTTTTKPVKPKITNEEYRTSIITLALTKLKQKKELI